MTRFRQLIAQDTCYLDPVCLAREHSDAAVFIHSQRLAGRTELAVVTVLIVANESVVHEDTVQLPCTRCARALSSARSLY